MKNDDWGDAQEVELTPEEKVKAYQLTSPIRKECQACFKWFETMNRWAERCPPCKKADKPKRKRIINKIKRESKVESPF